MNLNELKPGQTSVVQYLSSTSTMRRRLLDIGLVPGTKVKCIGRSPSGDPSAYLIRGAVIAIRSEDGKDIILKCSSEVSYDS